MRSVANRLWLLVLVAAACGGPQQAPKPLPDPAPDPGIVTPNPETPSTPRAVETPALVASPLPNDPVKATVHRLSNGMTVYISTDHQEPTIVAHVAVRAGSRHDPESSTGLAHYLEHMLFKGTSQLGTLDYAKEKPHLDRIAQLYGELRKPGADPGTILAEIDKETQASAAYAIPNELDQLYARIGVTGLNAFTDDDTTVYVCEIPKNRVAQWAHVEASRYRDAVFRLFWPELEAVYEEKNRGLDNPGRRVNEAFLRAMFPHHGYGYSSGIGEVEHLKKPDYAGMVAFFNRYYTPGNMAILLSGDVDESVIPLLEKEFASFQRPPGAAVEPGQPANLHGRQVVDVPVPAREGVVLGWPLVPATHPDRVALEVMDLLLLDGKSGIIDRDLLIPQKVATAGSNPTFKREVGWYELYADALAGQKHDELERLLLALVGKLQRGEFTDQDIQTAILQSELQWQQQLESNQGRLAMMEESFVDGIDWRDMVAHLERMRAVTKADIIRVAKQYLTSNFLVVRKVKGSFTPPKIEKPHITAVKVDPTRHSKFAHDVAEMAVPPIEPVAIKEGTDYQRGTLPTGPVIAVKNERNGLFAISHEYEYGRADDRLACLALEVMKVSGAGKRNAEQLARAFHELGVTADASCGKYQITISISGPDRNLEAGMALVRDWLAQPAFDDATLKAKIASLLTERANAIASPQAIAGAAQQYARFGAGSDALVVATNKQLQAAKPAQLKKLLARLLTLKHRTSYFGPRSLADASKLIALGTGKVAARAPRSTPFRKPNSTLLVDQETAQTHIWLFWPRPAANDNDRAVGTVFSEYAAPLLFQQVREARGLAYTVFGAYSPGQRKIDPASVLAYVGTQGDKTHDALGALLETLRAPVDDNRFAITKQKIEQNYRAERIPPRAIADVVYAWDDQGVKGDPRAARTKRALEVGKATLEAWTKAALARPLILSITGNRKLVDLAKLKQLAPVTVVDKSKLFGF